MVWRRHRSLHTRWWYHHSWALARQRRLWWYAHDWRAARLAKAFGIGGATSMGRGQEELQAPSLLAPIPLVVAATALLALATPMHHSHCYFPPMPPRRSRSQEMMQAGKGAACTWWLQLFHPTPTALGVWADATASSCARVLGSFPQQRLLFLLCRAKISPRCFAMR